MNLGSRIQKSTPFFPECTPYFDWQTVGLIHSFYTSGQPGNITRLLSCTDEDLKNYKGRDLAPTHYVPSMSRHPLTGDWYPAINKPTAVLHWLNHANVDAEFIVILDANTKLGHARPRSTVRAGQRTITLSSKKKERTITLAKISIEEQPNFNLLGKEKLEERRLPSQRLDPALPKLFWFTPAFPTCPTVAEQFWDIKRTSPEESRRFFYDYSIDEETEDIDAEIPHVDPAEGVR
ncbi:hypothetical protein RHGRI_038747 [Rhododendron griersonianum]|uniref:Uncharacterized protein n=1 Tax=Rhododendron griersonianum TaxID=479676 RepID=A0AAV6HL92_9ERIC|nr:hypothetical protein RHGRI_038747 [Rhododendron griersonianum]